MLTKAQVQHGLKVVARHMRKFNQGRGEERSQGACADMIRKKGKRGTKKKKNREEIFSSPSPFDTSILAFINGAYLGVACENGPTHPSC